MVLITDADLCDLCAKLYDPTQTWPMLWDEQSWGLCAAKTMFQDAEVVIHRGSTVALDWYDDLDSELIREDIALGSLPWGFSEPLRPWYEANKAHMSKDMVIIGHSLGAARAVEHAGMLTAYGLAPRAVVVWGEPKAGMRQLANVLAKAKVVVHSYRNLDDPVCTVPVTMGLLDWIHGHDIVALNEPPILNDPWLLLRDHHIELYQAGMRKLNPVPMV
jgi:Lipase (class 3)